MTKIASVSCALARVPLDTVTSFATRTVAARDYALVTIRGDDGTQGIGFCYAGSRAGGIVTMAVRELLAPMLIGRDPEQVNGLWREMYQESLLHGRVGAVMRALSMLDVAMWDLNARANRQPLYEYLGATGDEDVPAYASGGYYLAGKTPEMLGQELAGYVGLGFKAVKMKVGRLDPAQEEQRIRAAREAIGPDVILMLDANNAWADLATALQYMARYEPYDPYWIEEPFGPDDIDSHARLAEQTTVAVATGEIEAGRWRFKELLEKKAAAILQADAAVCGGISEYRRISAMAAAHGVTMCPHWFHDLHIHLVAADENGRYVEFFPDDKVLNFGRLIDRQLETRDGNLVLPLGEGLCFSFDEGALAKYAAEPWVEITG